MQYTKQTENGIYAVLIFFVWPFFSTLLAFYKYRESWAKNILWLFVAFYGYTMVIESTEVDAGRYRDQFIEMATTGTTTNIVTDLYARDSDHVDLLNPLLVKVVSLFTDNYKILFLAYGLIFGFFLSRNFWLLLDRTENAVTIIGLLLLIVFFVINPIWNINGFRFYAGSQIFVYGALIYFLKGKKSGVYIALSAILVHFSFMIPMAIFFLYRVLGNRLTLYFYIFIASLFITELNMESVRNNLLVISPVVFEQKIEGYTNEEYKERIEASYEGANWYVLLKTKALKYSIYIFLIVLYWRYRNFFKNKKLLYDLFSYVLLFYGIANIISSIPSAGRFITVASGLAIALLYLSLQLKNDTTTNIIIKATMPALLLYVIVVIRIGFDTMGVTTILGNPLIALFMEEDIPLINLIK